MPHPLDHLTHVWMLTTGRPIDRRTEAWLVPAPAARPELGGHPGGLLTSLDELTGPEFQATVVAPGVRDFYENTDDWDMGLRVAWDPVMRVGAQVMSRLWMHRLDQLALPTAEADLVGGVLSSVTRHETVAGPGYATWVRTLRSSGRRMYAGQYDVVHRPGARQPSVRVAFPLPSGWLVVLLRPGNAVNGAMTLQSCVGRFGDDGAYLVLLRDSGRAIARRVPIDETFRLVSGANDSSLVRAVHDLRLLGREAARLRYELRRR